MHKDTVFGADGIPQLFRQAGIWQRRAECSKSRQEVDVKSHDELMGEIEVLRDRISKLSAASLRISASLDLDTVLSEAVESARALTGTRWGAIITIGDSGQAEDFVFSGLTPNERHQMLGWADGPRFFEHLRDLEGALRLTDLHGYVRSLGLAPHPILTKTAMGTPMRHRGMNVGIFFLAVKADGREFSGEDEDVLMLFANQAATAVANARTYRDEHRARTDLEALVDTSPIGVAVFDARTGKPVLFNREARRIVEDLVMPGHSAEQLLEILKCRYADGREISLEEFPFAQLLSKATTVRAEEIVLEVPDGRSVTTLVNATPIHSEDGVIESVVVTVQDMAPLEEIERSRAEFLSLVSHELRAPLTSIKGSAARVLGALRVPDPAEMIQFFRIIDEQSDHMWGLISDLLDAGHIEAGTLSVYPGPMRVADLVDQARKTFLSGGARQTILMDLPPDLPRVLADEGRIVQVLNNLFSNASKHSPESSPIQVSAVLDGVHVAVSVSDEGLGIPPERLPYLFRKHARVGSDAGIGGSGLGLSICKGLVEAHGGRIWAESGGSGLGARFIFTVPVAEDSDSGAALVATPRLSSSMRKGRERTRVLVVDDDPQTLMYVRETLSEAGYVPLLTGDPREVSRIIKTKKPQLVLLDLMLPGMDGIELMESLSEIDDLPVIFISGYGRDDIVAKALERGACDYIIKPFSQTELVARVRAALRSLSETLKPFHLGSLSIDYAARTVTVAGHPVELTATEYELLRVLSVNSGRVTTYDSLLRRVWGGREIGLHVVRTCVKRVRSKLGDDASNPAYILTVRQVGYRMPRPNDP